MARFDRRLVYVALCGWLAASPISVYGQAAVPAEITPDSVRMVKKATVLLRVTDDQNQVAEGSGFFAIGQGIVVTNAHVVGMLYPHSKAPSKIDVVLHSGTDKEATLPGKLLGVDRTNDIAVLKVEGNLPAPLLFGSTDDLVETQKVYIFGFPFGVELGKNITVSESSVSSLRTNAAGELTQIQVNGGMQPGNSGGPVVNSQGLVVGVSVAVIRNTQINFAIPGQIVRSLLAGNILESKSGQPYRASSQVRVPLHYECLDAYQRIRTFDVDVWTGKPSGKRSFSTKQAKTEPGDGPRHPVRLEYSKSVASGEVALPKLADGQVAWVQPVVTLPNGFKVWGAPQSFDPSDAIERVAADLKAKFTEQQQRSVHLKTAQTLMLYKGKSKFSIGQLANIDLLESFSPNPKGMGITVGFGQPDLSIDENGNRVEVPRDVALVLQRIPPRFVVDETNRLRERGDTNLNPQLPAELRESVADFLSQICNGYESSTFIIPNRKVEPHESWPVKMPMLLKTGAKPEVVDLVMTCTYEGVRKKGSNTEAVVSFAGSVQGREPSADNRVSGGVSGKFTFDAKHGFISSSHMTITSEASSASSDMHVEVAFDVELTRVEGNSQNLASPSGIASNDNNPAIGNRPTSPGSPQTGKRPDARNISSPERSLPSGSHPFKGLFQRPEKSSTLTSYLHIESAAGDYIGQGKTFDYTADQLKPTLNGRSVNVMVDGWHLVVGGPNKQALSVGEYPDAKRFPFNGSSPGLSFSGKGRGLNTLSGAFAIWQLEMSNGKITKLAIDFEQAAAPGKPKLTGKVRINSNFE
jgi:hypothetical protein